MAHKGHRAKYHRKAKHQPDWQVTPARLMRASSATPAGQALNPFGRLPSRLDRLTRLTRSDLAPTQLHVHVYETAYEEEREDEAASTATSKRRVRRRTRKDYLGALRFAPAFARYLDDALKNAPAEVWLGPGGWWQSRYYRERLEQAGICPPDVVRACAQLRALRSWSLDWMSDEWDGEDDDVLHAHEAQVDAAERAIAAELTTPEGRPRTRDWLDLQDRKLLRAVKRLFFIRRRHPAPRPQDTERPKAA